VTTQWRKIPGYPGYKISDDGVVYSIPRKVGAKLMRSGQQSRRVISGRPLTLTKRPCGTTAANLWHGGECQQVPIRRLMLLAFVGPQPFGMDAVNIDGDVTNNSLDNLRWEYRRRAATAHQRAADQLRVG